MRRKTLVDADGQNRWFDADSAIRFDEATRWNGNNHISIPTGSQWEHQSLYYTRSKRWVLHCWSQVQGSYDDWREITEEEAVQWLVQNEEWDCEELPKDVQERVKQSIDAYEL